MLFLVNPPTATKRKRRKHSGGTKQLAAQRKRKTRPTVKQIAARKKFVARVQAGAFRRGTASGSVKARRESVEEITPRRKSGGSMAGKKKSRRGVKRRRRSVVALVRRNEPSMGGRRRTGGAKHRHKVRVHKNPAATGIVGQLGGAAVDAAVILVGKGVTNKVAGMVPVGGTTPAMTATKQVAVGLVLSMVTKKVAPRFAHQVLIGGLLAPMETLLAKVPVIGPAITPSTAAEPAVTGATSGTGAYLPRGSSSGVGSYIAWPQGNAGLSGDVRDHSRLGTYDDTNPGLGIDFNDESGTGQY